MAQERDFSNKNSPNSSDNEDEEANNGNNSMRPDLGFENVNYSNNAPENDGNRNEKKAQNQTRKEESTFSFKHFLKRDLSLPSTSASYEGTGARPKVRDAAPAGALPDFVQDHLAPEQAYPGGGAPGLPDFTLSSRGLDLTNCVERPPPAPHPFPANASGGESFRLPDFLPAQGRGEAAGRGGRRDRTTHQNIPGNEDNLVAALRLEVEQLKLELRSARAEVEELRGGRRGVARSLLFATNTAESSLRELLSGLEQVRALASSLEPP